MNYSLPGPSVHGILQGRILEWVTISFSRGSSQPREQPASPTLVGGFFTTEPRGKPNFSRNTVNTFNSKPGIVWLFYIAKTP